MSIPWDDCMWKEIMFTHVEDRTKPDSRISHFLVGRMGKSPKIEALPIVGFPRDALPPYDYLKSNWGLEQHRVDRITVGVIMSKPCLIGRWGANPEEDCILIDGAHRIAKAHLLRLPGVPMRIIPQDLLEEFRVEALPFNTDAPEVRDMLQHGFSGIA